MSSVCQHQQQNTTKKDQEPRINKEQPKHELFGKKHATANHTHTLLEKKAANTG
jgi:hypothetical protein